jgi:hypothetical protein
MRVIDRAQEEDLHTEEGEGEGEGEEEPQAHKPQPKRSILLLPISRKRSYHGTARDATTKEIQEECSH